MSSLTLLTGGASSGKTSRLIEMLAGRYADDPFAKTLVLVPTARHADQFRRRLVSWTGIAFGLDVTTIGLFAARHIPAGSLAPREASTELLSRIIRQRVAGDGPASRFRPIGDTPGLVTLISTAVFDLIADGVHPAQFSAAAVQTSDADLQALADVYEAYDSALTTRGWRDPRAAASVAAHALRPDTTIAPVAVVDGAQFLRGGEAELIAALATRADMWVALDPTAGSRALWTIDALTTAVPTLQREEMPSVPPRTAVIEASTAADAEAQLREIARSVKDRLTTDRALRPSDFAVVFRQVSPHLSLARRVFAEARLPLDPAAGERLSERPFGAWALRLLRVGVHGWLAREMAEVLAAGFTAGDRWGLRPGHVESLRSVVRNHQLWSGLDALLGVQAAVEGDLVVRPRATAPWWQEAAAGWTRAVDALAAILDPDAARTPGEHARLLDDALFGARAWVRAELDDYPTLATETDALRRVFSGFRAVDESLGSDPIRFADFIALLESQMQRPSTLIREAGGVLLAPMHTLHGLRFAHVYLAGLSEGEFPAPRRTGELLDAAARVALQRAGLQLPPAPRAEEDELWRTATTRAESAVSLWRARLDAGGRPTAASYYFIAAGLPATDVRAAPVAERAASTRELAVALARAWPGETRRPADLPAWALIVRVAAPVEQRRRSFASAGRFEGVLQGADLTNLTGSSVVWSPTRLESYRTCSFQFFASYPLGLRELEEQQEQADAATRGTVMHEMLDDAITPLAERGLALDTSTVDEVVARLRARGLEIWNRAPEQHAFGRAALWRYEGDQALDQLESMVRREAALNEQLGIDAVVGGEEEFSGTLAGVEPPMQVLGRSDRVDRGAGLIQIVDYKTGRPIEIGEVRSGRRLQLQLYALAARERFGDVRLVARYAFLRPPRDEWFLDSANPEHRLILDASAAIAAEVRASVDDGAFEVAAQGGPCPSYCAFQHACRVNTFSRRKTWR